MCIIFVTFVTSFTLKLIDDEKIVHTVILAALDDGVSHAVAAGVRVELCLRRLPAGIPDRIAVLDIEIVTVGILWRIVVAESGEPEKLGVLVEAVTSSRVGYDRKEFFTSKIIDPGKRSSRRGNDVFFIRVVKITVFHGNLLLVMIGVPDYIRHLGIKDR
jgi:hypothetical protein